MGHHFFGIYLSLSNVPNGEWKLVWTEMPTNNLQFLKLTHIVEVQRRLPFIDTHNQHSPAFSENLHTEF